MKVYGGVWVDERPAGQLWHWLLVDMHRGICTPHAAVKLIEATS